MAPQEPHELRATEVRSGEVADEMLAPATPGAENLGSPDTPSEVATGSDEADAVLAPATPGAEILGAETDTPGAQAD